MIDGVVLVAGQAAWLAGLAALCAGLGVLTWHGIAGRTAVGMAMAAAIGLAVLAQAALLFALAGLLSITVPLAIVASLAGWRLAWTGRVPLQWPPRASVPWIVVAVVPAFVLALYPPTGFDQTMYHLPFAELFAATGAVPVAPDLRFPVFPPLVELLQALVLPGGGAIATQQLGVLALAVACALAWESTERIVSGPIAPALAVATVGGAPLMLHGASAGYLEPVLACWSLAGLRLAFSAADAGSPRQALIAGALGGSLVGVKYTGLVMLAAAWLPLLQTRGSRATRWRLLLPWTIAAAAGAAPSTLRLVWLTGNPVFPLLPSIFGASPWYSSDVVMASGSMIDAVTLLADAVLRRSRVGGMPPGPPLLLLTVPVACVAAWRRWPAAGPIACTLGAWLVLVPHSTHYLVAVLPHAAVLTAAGLVLIAAHGRWVRQTLLAIAMAAALCGPAYVAYRWRLVGGPPTTAAARDAWTLARLPVLAAVRWLNARDPDAVVYGISAERYVWFAKGRLLGDYNGPWRHDAQVALARSRGASAVLDRMGARFLLVRRGVEEWPSLLAHDPGLRVVFADASAIVYERVAATAAAVGLAGRGLPLGNLRFALAYPITKAECPASSPQPSPHRRAKWSACS